MCRAILDWVAECLESARKKGRLRFKGTPADRATLVISTLLSSLLLSRAMGEPVFGQMVDRLLEDLGADWRTGDLPRERDYPSAESPSFTSKIKP
jgi:hypothetical protein